MADEGDTESEDEVEYSGMIQPPLINQLKTILAEYPDDGQILKELIQNAEDAEAREMKILYDGRRCVQGEVTKKTPFRKYFQGPALIVYNNAAFTEEDWTGIKMLYSSIKEFDRSKVGRFGLGFKSVFHITDYPLVVSGKQLLVIDPHQDSSRVCQTMQLKKLNKYRKMKVEDCAAAFFGVFGFCQTTLDEGYFDGTMFRFPLRQVETKLSDNIYTKNKVEDLFISFQDEASVMLLFLKCLEKISIFKQNIQTVGKAVGQFCFSVHIDSTETVRSVRNDFHRQIKQIRDGIPDSTICNGYNMKICIQQQDSGVVHRNWKVMNMFKGGQMSPNLQLLSKDQSLSYSPYVGIAMDMDNVASFIGHIFCFLPLPMTERSLTGLPLHINGFFALSQNRRVVKWPTADQIRHGAHTDKSIQWNTTLIEEVVSELYVKFIKECINESNRLGNTDDAIETVTRCIPHDEEINEHWKILIQPLKARLKNIPLFFSKNGQKWLTVQEAVFVRQQWKEQISPDVMKDVLDVLYLYRINIVEIEDHVWDFLGLNLASVQEVTPAFLHRIFRDCDKYSKCSPTQKLNFLRFLASDGIWNNFDCLQLLHLQNNTFVRFSKDRHCTQVYLCSKEQQEILPGMAGCLLNGHGLPHDLHEIYQKLAENEIFQVRPLQSNGTAIIQLLKLTIDKNCKGSQTGEYLMWKTNSIQVFNGWIDCLWNYLNKYFPVSLDLLGDLNILPIHIEHGSKALLKLTDIIVLGPTLSKNVSACLKRLSINVVTDLPHSVKRHPKIFSFIHQCSVSDISDAIGRLHSAYVQRDVVEFNQKCSKAEKEEFRLFMSKEKLKNSKSKQVISELDLFATNTGNNLVSVSEVRRYLTKDIPVKYPSQVLVSKDLQVQKLIKNLGGIAVEDHAVFTEVLQCLKRPRYTDQEIVTMMKYIVDKKVYKLSDTILSLVKLVPFVPNKDSVLKPASQLFDPEDEIVSDIIVDQALLPHHSVASSKYLKILRKLGLKSVLDLTADHVYATALYLHEKSYCMKEQVCSEVHRKVKTILHILENKPCLLNDRVQGCHCLQKQLMEMQIIIPLAESKHYVHSIPWYRPKNSLCTPKEVYSSKYEMLIGSVCPLISAKTSACLMTKFGWNKMPANELVCQQHNILRENYTDKRKSEFMLPIKELYTFLANQYKNGRSSNICLLGEIWMGDGFCPPKSIYMKEKPDDISLKPYMHKLPVDFQTSEMINLMKFLGCTQYQCSQVLVDVLHMIKRKHESNILQEKVVQSDLDLTIRILNKLKSDDDACNYDILFPVHNNTGHLELRSAKDCNYCNAEWLKEVAEEEGDTMLFVHANIPSDTADKLGVPSLTDSLLADTEGIQEWGQSEPLTRRLKNLLTDYKDGFAVPKEIIQNADDAKAETVRFLYDERENSDCRTRLIDENMESCQGPALWAFNDAVFSKKDLENITKLSGATKAEDSSKVGKFGLGFCSVYNLTDVPSFITESTMVIFDPHAKYLGKAVKKSNPGIKIDLRATKNKLLLKRMKNQFKPFNHVFGCDLDCNSPSFHGTLFRFPLRTKQQACESEISDKDYDQKEMRNMIHMYVQNAGNLLLFTQHVKVVEFYHLSKNGNIQKPEFLHRVNRECNIGRTNILSEFSSEIDRCKRNDWKSKPSEMSSVFIMTIKTELSDKKSALLDVREKGSQTKWLVSWASGTRASLQLAKTSVAPGAVPLASVAAFLQSESGSLKCKSLKSTPFGYYKGSHIFCYLPLPVTTQLPIHVNGSFAVSSNRRQLTLKTSDDFNMFEHNWNVSLLEDAVTRAYINLLENLQRFNISVDEYSDFWPVPSKKMVEMVKESLCKAFYISVIQQNNSVFCRDHVWVPITNCSFIDPDLLSSVVGDIVLEASINYLEKDGNTIVKLKKDILHTIEHFHGGIPDIVHSRIISAETFFEDVFFCNIEDGFWNTTSLQKLLLYALDNPTKRIKQIMENTECIPTRPHGKLRRPKDLVNIHGKVAKMYLVEDERFIISAFEGHDRIEMLKSLGMMTNEITDDFLLERIISINRLATLCIGCSLERCKTVLKFISECKLPTEEAVKRMQNVEFLPVLCKPKDWHYTWYAEKNDDRRHFTQCKRHATKQTSCRFARPVDLFSNTCKNLVGCEQLLLDETIFQCSHIKKQELLSTFGVRTKSQIASDIVIIQLRNISQSVNTKQSIATKRDLQCICDDIYDFLDDICLKNKDTDMTQLQHIPCILVEDVFVQPQKVAVTSPVLCAPALYSLDRLNVRKKTAFLERIGVKKEFDVKDVMSELIAIKMDHFSEGILNQTTVDLACRLVRLLSNTIKRTKTEFKEEDLCIPDENGKLTAVKDLCLDDDVRIQRGRHMRYPHGQISPDDATILGVQSKVLGSLKQFSRTFRPFGQKEELTTRIKKLLKGYPCDEGILKEMLQNADDAGATEIKFITDFNYYSTETTFGESWNVLQGPALLIYNDSYFTENDLEGIQHLGLGSKGDDPTRTGQYGVGFNAVYHLTDAPSFLSRASVDSKTENTLCIMDPHCHYVPGATKENPGMQYFDLDELRVSFSDVFACYHEDVLLSDSGTVFRLPLRSKYFTEKSALRKKEITEDFITQLLTNMKLEMEKCLLFLRNVKRISVGSICNGKLKTEYCVEKKFSSKEDLEKKKVFDMYVENVAKEFRIQRDISVFKVKEVSYFTEVHHSDGKTTTWFLKQRFGFDEGTNVPDTVDETLKNGSLGLLPFGGIALLMNRILDEATAYSFLPLPVRTGLKVHVNGHFALDHEARRNLWTDDKLGYRSDWNKLLLQNVIAPIYSSAIEIQLSQLAFMNIECLAKEIQSPLKWFHSLFPDTSLTKDQHWKLLAQSVYRHIFQKEKKLFLSCHINDCNQCEVSAFSLHEEDNEVSRVVFNEKYRGTEYNKIVQVAKQLKMKVVDTPLNIMKSIQECGIETTTFTPDLFCTFLRSYSSSHDGKCDLEANNVELNKTKLANFDHLETCLRFCMKSESFNKTLNGLPLCLTENNSLKAFSITNPIIVTSFWDLLPSSSNEMLHHKLHSCIAKETSGCTRELSIDIFAELLNSDLNYDLYRYKIVNWDGSLPTIPNKTWIKRVWIFLQSHVRDIQNQTKLLSVLNPLLYWSIIPTTRKCGKRFLEWTHSLTPIHMAKFIIDIESFSSTLRKSLDKLNIPILDVNCLPGQHPLLQLIASANRPKDVLECLYHHRNEMENSINLLSTDCDHILEYFAGVLQTLLNDANRQNFIDFLRALPFFVTVHGNKINLLQNHSTLVLPIGLPPDGMKEWAQKTGKILLRQNERLKGIFHLFDVQESTTCDVYRLHILPAFENIPINDRLVHLKFIKNNLLKTSGNFDSEQEFLINALKKLAFVPHGNKEKTASEFFSPFNELMKTMCENLDMFPPPPFCDYEWQSFMKLAGMKTETTVDLFIQFAKTVETQGSIKVTDEVRHKSNLLIQHLLNRENVLKEDILERVSEIKFVVPYRLNNFYLQLCRPFHQERSHLVCYKGSVSSAYETVAWTNCTLIPKSSLPECSRACEKLEITEPNVEIVTQHIINVCRTISAMKENHLSRVDPVKISSLLEKFYEFVNINISETSNELEKLKDVPFVFIREKYLVLPCNRIVTEMSEWQEIKPYMMLAPRVFGKYFALFETLGATKTVTANTYAKVLERIFHETGNSLDPNSIKSAQKSIRKLLTHLPFTHFSSKPVPENLLSVDCLFLLDSKNQLTDATQLIFSDRPYIMKMIENKIEFSFNFMCEIDHMSDYEVEQKLKSLPDRFKPKFLSDIVTSECSIGNKEVTDTTLSTDATFFLTCDDFINGIMRLVCKENSYMPDINIPENYESSIRERLKKITVRHVENLTRVYTVQGREIHSVPCDFYYERNNKCEAPQYDIYCNEKEGESLEEWVTEYDLQIISVIKDCTGCNFTNTTSYIHKMLHCLPCPENIERILDKGYIPRSLQKSSNNRLPKPGSPVELKWHTLLDNNFICFEEGDYVALLVDESKHGITYIYAVIVERLESPKEFVPFLNESLQEYIVQVDTFKKERRKAYDLYKVSRSVQNGERGLVLYQRSSHAEEKFDYENEDNRPLDEIFSEIREVLQSLLKLPNENARNKIYKRLLRKWHPDKNPSNTILATKVFQYIQIEMERLSASDKMNNMTNENSNAPYSPSWYDDMKDDVQRDFDRQKKNQQKYSNRSKRKSSGNYSAPYEPDPQPAIAMTWLEQAKHDLRSAKDTYPCGTCDCNWIFYLCHQAAEKALCAFQYDCDSKKVVLVENLARLASSMPELPDNLKKMAKELELLSGGSRRMRYPENAHRPHQAYAKATIDKALQLTTEIVDSVDELINT